MTMQMKYVLIEARWNDHMCRLPWWVLFFNKGDEGVFTLGWVGGIYTNGYDIYNFEWGSNESPPIRSVVYFGANEYLYLQLIYIYGKSWFASFQW